MWGVEGGNGKVEEKLLSPLGLTSYGGGSKNGEMSYSVFNDDKSFNVELTREELKDIKNIYYKFKQDLRKEKIKIINENGTTD